MSTPLVTPLIRFNVGDRGRQHRGTDRNYDPATLAAVINSPEVQERVRNRDLQGYYGHWPRKVFGIEPGEGGVVGGRAVPLEPCVVTTVLRAMPDGTIEHQSEFLDTAPGRVAARMYLSKRGGFSAVIRARVVGNRDYPISFHGFDYVCEPNYTTNRGFLDGVDSGELEGQDDEALALLLDSVGEVSAMDLLMRELQADNDRMAQALVHLEQQNRELVAMAARNDSAVARLDSAGGRSPVLAPRVLSVHSSAVGLMASQFLVEPIVGVEPQRDPEREKAKAEGRTLMDGVAGFFAGLGR
jgi:hypothetical protein